jgi:hypothetical protein
MSPDPETYQLINDLYGKFNDIYKDIVEIKTTMLTKEEFTKIKSEEKAQRREYDNKLWTIFKYIIAIIVAMSAGAQGPELFSLLKAFVQ